MFNASLTEQADDSTPPAVVTESATTKVEAGMPLVNTKQLKTHPAAEDDWAEKALKFKRSLDEEQLNRLANRLSVRPIALKQLHIGCTEIYGRFCFTFPEFSGDGLVVGIGIRFEDGLKGFLNRGRRGLYVPGNWFKCQGPVLLVEGATDTAALTSMGLAGIGRPSAKAGVEELVGLLAPWPLDRPIIVLGEIDSKSDGRWVGQDAAEQVAGQLTERLGREVSWAPLPDNQKNVRVWLANSLSNDNDEETPDADQS